MNSEQDKTHRSDGMETATLAGGCFWCLEAIFTELKGVSQVVSGYSGGSMANPTYREVCTGTTSHAEAVQVTFDPVEISYNDILRVFFSIHNPTTLNRQGPDRGTQYRSAIFYHTQEQKETAEQIIQELGGAKIWGDPIVTEVVPFKVFYRAEDYHQEYFRLHNEEPYCSILISPKVAKFRKQFFDRLKK